MRISKHILPIIIISQFFCTSLWFAGNSIINDLVSNFAIDSNALGHLTSSVQFGFIIGTLTFAILTIADRFSPSKVFCISAVFGALFNIGIIWEGNTLISLLILRFFTGFFLAGIYPIGMKIATDYYEKGLGKSLGFLVGALVIGTAFPHLLKGITHLFEWTSVLMTTSTLAIVGGLLMFTLVPDGPFRKTGSNVNLLAFFNVFNHIEFRKAAIGYFGHMWELYTFWAFVPVMIQSYNSLHPASNFNIPVLSFIIIGSGSITCVIGGYISQSFGTKKAASIFLSLSAVCCLISPLLFMISYKVVFIGFMVFWGMVVIADSPLFSTLVAQNAKAEIKGTALTIVNCLGFLITIISIQLISYFSDLTNSTNIYLTLAAGPIIGLIILLK